MGVYGWPCVDSNLLSAALCPASRFYSTVQQEPGTCLSSETVRHGRKLVNYKTCI